MTILTLFAVIVVPRFISFTMRRHLDVAVEGMESNLKFARARSISTGLRHQFGVDPTTREVLVQAFRPEEAAGTTAATTNQQVVVPDLRDELPEEVRVVEWSVTPLGYGTTGSASPTVADGTPLIFYPEGISDNALLVLEEPGGDRRAVSVDGATGAIRILREDELRP